MKFLKDAETRELEKARKRKAAEDKIISELEQKGVKRKEVVDAAESKYNSDMQLYQSHCQRFGVSDPAFIRLALLIHERNVRQFAQPGEWRSLIESYNLTKFAAWLNELCPPEKPPQKREVAPLEEGD